MRKLTRAKARVSRVSHKGLEYGLQTTVYGLQSTVYGLQQGKLAVKSLVWNTRG